MRLVRWNQIGFTLLVAVTFLNFGCARKPEQSQAPTPEQKATAVAGTEKKATSGQEEIKKPTPPPGTNEPKEPAGEEEKPVQVIKQMGGAITRDEKAPGKPVIAIDLRLLPLKDEALKELAAFPQLKKLHLYDTPVTDAGLKEVARLQNLEFLDLRSTPVTDAGLKELAGLQKLQTLDLSDTQVTDAGLQALAGLKGLKSLDLRGTKTTKAGVAELKKALPDLQVSQ